MHCFIYKSARKDDMYLYLLEKDQFTQLPETLARIFGPAEFVMTVDLDARTKLAREDIQRVRQKLQDDGFYLQMPAQVVALNPAGNSESVK